MENDGKEEVHILKDNVAYSISDESTFTRRSIAGLEEIVGEQEKTQRMLKLHLAD